MTVYSAIYSGVPVYEILCDDVAVMRRMADNYMNATQILKVAGFSKPKRTKILEKEILEGTHEKVQGGYGKYQGTWIPLETSKELAERYQITEVIGEILNFDPLKDEIGSKPAQREKIIKNEDDDDDFQREALPLLRRTPSRSRQPSQQSPVTKSWTAQQEPTPQYYESPLAKSSSDFVKPHLPKRLFDQEAYQTEFFHAVLQRRHMKDDGEEESHVIEQVDITDPQLSKICGQDNDQRRKEVLMAIFLDEDKDRSLIALFENLKQGDSFQVDMRLDDRSSTPLHWAAACARIDMVEGLLLKGAKPDTMAYGGELALMRAIYTTRNYEKQTFEQLVHLLEQAMFVPDCFGRTVLHHIAILSQAWNKRKFATYYLTCIAQYMQDYRHTSIPFATFMDYQDLQGNTALLFAFKFKYYRMVDVLLQLGANPDIQNQQGESVHTLPKDSRLAKILERNDRKKESLVDDYDDPVTSDDERKKTYTGYTRAESASTVLSNFEVETQVITPEMYQACQDIAIARTRKTRGKERLEKIPNEGFEPQEKRIKFEQPEEEELYNQVTELEQALVEGNNKQKAMIQSIEDMDQDRERRDAHYRQKIAHAIQIPDDSVEDIIQACTE